MLIILNETIAKIDPNDIEQSRALEALLITFHQKNHIIFLEMKLLRYLQEAVGGNLSAGGRATLISLYNKLPEYKKITEIVDHKIIVYIEDEKRSGVSNEGSIWYIPLKYFSSISIIGTAIIGENPSDAELCIKFAENYIGKNKIKGFYLNARKLCGGGSVTPRTLVNYLSSEFSPCLCLTDSDKLHPDFKNSDTTKNCAIAARLHTQKIIKHHSIDEREIENVLPIDFLKKLNGGMEFVSDFNNYIFDEINQWKYIDIKKGISYKWLFKQDAATKKYWKKASKSISGRAERCYSCSDIDMLDRKDCDCIIIRGMGDNVLANAIKYFDSNPVKNTLRLLEEDLRWEYLAKLTFDFAIAPQGERSR